MSVAEPGVRSAPRPQTSVLPLADAKNLRVLVLNASPRADGNTMALARLLLSHLPGAHEVLSAYELAVAPCTACGACASNGVCVIGDNMAYVWNKIAGADIIVIASPLHFTSLTAPMVALISRWESHWHFHRSGEPSPLGVRRRVGAVVSTGGSDYPNMFECARRVALAGFTTLGVEMCGVLSVSGMDGGGGKSANFSEETLREARSLARSMLARRRTDG
jgi:multimeric flavodoxin WrbA